MIFGESKGDSTASWRPEPSSRGTFNILSTCIITLLLCIWTAVHLNLPGRNERLKPLWRSKQLRRKVGWLCLGLFTPERVAWLAFVQYREAYSLYCDVCTLSGQPRNDSYFWRLFNIVTCANVGDAEKLNDNEGTEMRPCPSDSSNINQRHPWTLVHSFYAVMGGFAIDTSNRPARENYIPGGHSRLALTPPAIRLLFKKEPHLIPNLSSADIEDKSKGSGVAKAIVCVQAFWFCLQCITRMTQGLSISLLELNVFAHSLCALFIYMMWWNKPLDIAEPTLIQRTDMDGIVALMCMISGIGGFKSKGGSQFFYWRKRESMNDSNDNDLSIQSEHSRNCLASEVVNLSNIQHRVPTIPDWNGHDNDYGFVLPRDGLEHRELLLCCKLASQTLQQYGAAEIILPLGCCPTFLVKRSSEFYSPEIVNRRWNIFAPSKEPFEYSIMRYMTFGIIITGLIYGGLHLLAWNAPFRTSSERALWRASSIFITVSGLGLTPGAFWVNKIDRYRILRCLNEPMLIALIAISSLPDAAARVYLVVECFLALPYLPDSVFEVPNWSTYVPHIS